MNALDQYKNEVELSILSQVLSIIHRRLRLLCTDHIHILNPG